MIRKLNDFDQKIEYIIPVPLHKKRIKERKYNQAGIMASYLSKKIKVQVFNNLLIKKENRNPQAKLGQKERIENAKDIYHLNNKFDKNKFFNKNLLIIDDVATTAATINECAKTLKELKPNKIFVLTIARSIKFYNL